MIRANRNLVRQREFLAFLLIVASSSFSIRGAAPETAPPPTTPAASVSLVIDYGDGVQKHFVAVPWQKAMTVHDLLNWAQKHPRGITFRTRGSGNTLFLLEIDRLASTSGDERHWIYSVNGKLGDRSFGQQTLEPGDTVLWKFDEYE